MSVGEEVTTLKLGKQGSYIRLPCAKDAAAEKKSYYEGTNREAEPDNRSLKSIIEQVDDALNYLSAQITELE